MSKVSDVLLLRPVLSGILGAAVVAAIAFWPIRSYLLRPLAALFSGLERGLDNLPPGILFLCLFLSILVSCGLMMAGVIYSARHRVLEDLCKRLRRLESLVITSDTSATEWQLRVQMERLSGELERLRTEFTAVRRHPGYPAGEPLPMTRSDFKPAEFEASAAAGADTAVSEQDVVPPPDPPFAPVRETHMEALEAMHGGDLPTSERLLRQALRICEERNETALTRGVIQYDLARLLASQGDVDTVHKRERYASALNELRFSRAALDGAIHFRFLDDLDQGGAFYQLMQQPDFEPAVTDLMSLIQVA